MQFQKLAGITVAAALMTFGVANPAAATPPTTTTTWTYNFGTLVTGKDSGDSHAPALDPNDTFARLAVSTSDNQNFLYKLTVSNDLNTIFNSSGVYIDALSVNTTTSTNPKSVSLVVGGVNKITLDNGGQTIGSVKYDFTDTFGNSQNRLKQGELVTWTTTYKNPIINSVFADPAFALGVNGITYATKGEHNSIVTHSNGTGEYLGAAVAAVPEPESYAMMIAGLGLLGFVTRRKQQQAV